MNKEKQTFTDREGHEIESTWLAQKITLWIENIIHFTLCSSVFGLFILFSKSKNENSFSMLFLIWILSSLLTGLITGSIQTVFEKTAMNRRSLYCPVHDRIARWQHFRHQRSCQRKLLEAEWAGVPDGAISRARPLFGQPEPSASSLSVAESPEEDRPRLKTSVDEPTTEEAVVEVCI